MKKEIEEQAILDHVVKYLGDIFKDKVMEVTLVMLPATVRWRDKNLFLYKFLYASSTHTECALPTHFKSGHSFAASSDYLEAHIDPVPHTPSVKRSAEHFWTPQDNLLEAWLPRKLACRIFIWTHLVRVHMC